MKNTLLEEFSIYLTEIKGLSYNTVKSYRNDIEYFIKYIKDIRKLPDESKQDAAFFESITLNEMEEFLSLLSEGIKNRRIIAIKVFYKYLYSEVEAIQRNITIKLKKEKKESPLSEEEIDQVFKGISQRHKERDMAILMVFFSTKIKLPELVSLNLKDIDYTNGKVMLAGKEEKTFLLSKEALKALKKYISKERTKYKNNEALFLSQKGERITTRTIERMVEKINLKPEKKEKQLTLYQIRNSVNAYIEKIGEKNENNAGEKI